MHAHCALISTANATSVECGMCVFFSLFISYDGHRVAKRRGLRVGALAVAVAVGVAAVAGRKSRTRGELSESEANEPKAKRFQLAKW